MAKVSLREYLNGIEELIDDGRTEDSLAHCRHILSHFPKNVATYRMMGKTYLEAHQYKDAEDIFRRVLSSLPDDFVSHIGMSIIREEGGDLDGSIWNMERAFEAQPSNRAVQDELRRLYGKREGYAPPKVRLTRGALARMYAHGDLYNQAIGELRNALTEDPQRPDLQVLLAEMYFKTKRDTEAIEVCSSLIDKLPYCLFANRLLVDLLRNNQRDLESRPYLDRVEELDPYAALVDSRSSLETATAESVMLEQLIIESGEATTEPKGWTASLEMKSSTFEKEELPEWLSADTVGESDESKQDSPSKSASGMLESLEGLEPIPTSELGISRPKNTGAALSDDQVPDWLRELRPSTTSLAAEEKNLASEIESPEPFESEPEEQRSAFVTEDSISEEITKQPPILHSATEDDESLGWLEKLAAQQGVPEDELLTTPEDRESAKPDWLPDEKQASEHDELAWLDDMAIENGQAPKEQLQREKPESEPAADVSASAEMDKTNTTGTTPVWLKDLSAEIGEVAKEDENVSPDVAPRPLEEAPDWLSELRPSTDEIKAAQNAVDETINAESDEPNSAVDLSTLDWLEEMGPPKTLPPIPTKNEWLPETPPVEAGKPDQTSPVSIPVVSSRRTAALLAEQEAPGRLEQARQALNYGKLNEAADHYGYLLHRRLLIKDVIADLDAAVHRHPGDATLWQTLGDAYMRNNQLREALDCYTRAEDLL